MFKACFWYTSIAKHMEQSRYWPRKSRSILSSLKLRVIKVAEKIIQELMKEYRTGK